MPAFHHVAISTPNLEQLVAFYTTHFGATEVRRNKWGANNQALNLRFGLTDSSADVALLAIGGAYLEIFQFHAAPDEQKERTNWKPGFTHFCVQVESCQNLYSDLTAAGVEFAAEPLTMPTGATFAYARDPDGNTVEILDIPANSDFPSVI